jgi:hypothetical protein
MKIGILPSGSTIMNSDITFLAMAKRKDAGSSIMIEFLGNAVF